MSSEEAREEDYEVVQRPGRRLRLPGKKEYSYPIEVVVASADTGTAVRLYLKDEPSTYRDTSGASKKHSTARSRALTSMRHTLRTRGFALEWSRDPVSADYILVWAVRQEEG